MNLPIKVYFENRKIEFTTPESPVIKGESSIKSDLDWTGFIHFTGELGSDLILTSENPLSAFRKFAAMFDLKEAAGGLVSDPGENWLFIYRRDRWDLPKGVIEEGEQAGPAAIREVEEECGISRLRIVRPLQPTFHVYPLNENRWILKKTHWFFMKTLVCCRAEPQLSEGITRAEWKDPDDLEEVFDCTYGNIKELLEACLNDRKSSRL